MSEYKSKMILKRVRISRDNMTLLEKQAKESDLTISEYLDKLVNESIIFKSQEEQRKNPLYVWRT